MVNGNYKITLQNNERKPLSPFNSPNRLVQSANTPVTTASTSYKFSPTTALYAKALSNPIGYNSSMNFNNTMMEDSPNNNESCENNKNNENNQQHASYQSPQMSNIKDSLSPTKFALLPSPSVFISKGLQFDNNNNNYNNNNINANLTPRRFIQQNEMIKVTAIDFDAPIKGNNFVEESNENFFKEFTLINSPPKTPSYYNKYAIRRNGSPNIQVIPEKAFKMMIGDPKKLKSPNRRSPNRSPLRSPLRSPVNRNNGLPLFSKHERTPTKLVGLMQKQLHLEKIKRELRGEDENSASPLNTVNNANHNNNKTPKNLTTSLEESTPNSSGKKRKLDEFEQGAVRSCNKSSMSPMIVAVPSFNGETSCIVDTKKKKDETSPVKKIKMDTKSVLWSKLKNFSIKRKKKKNSPKVRISPKQLAQRKLQLTNEIVRRQTSPSDEDMNGFLSPGKIHRENQQQNELNNLKQSKKLKNLLFSRNSRSFGDLVSVIKQEQEEEKKKKKNNNRMNLEEDLSCDSDSDNDEADSDVEIEENETAIKPFTLSKEKQENRQSVVPSLNFTQLTLQNQNNNNNNESSSSGGKITFEQVLQTPHHREYFIKHCQLEYSTENIEFWMEVKLKYKFLLSKQHRLKLAKQLFDEYVSLNASKALNIDKKAIQAVKNRIEKAESSDINNNEDDLENLFDSIVTHIISVMLDSFRRFQLSNLFQEMTNNYSKIMKEVNNGRPLTADSSSARTNASFRDKVRNLISPRYKLQDN
ncbi:hypothetical protein ABK040_016256 [Willaertia magna]